MQHKHALASLLMKDRKVVDLLDLTCRTPGNSLWEMIIAQCSKDSHKWLFIVVDRNNFNKNANFTSPTKYYKEAHNRMVRINHYLYIYHGESVLQFFLPMGQEMILHTDWNFELKE